MEKARYIYYPRRSRLTDLLSSGSFVTGAILAFVLAFAQELLGAGLQNLFIGSMGALLFLAAVRQSYAHRVSERELITQFGYMARIYANSYRMLYRTRDPVEKREILRALGQAALDEIGRWIMRHREQPISGSRMFQLG